MANGSEEANQTQEIKTSSAKQDDTIFRLVYLGFIISGLIALLVIGGVILIAVAGSFGTKSLEIPPVLENWGGVIMGFYFGAFVTLIKDYIKIKST